MPGFRKTIKKWLVDSYDCLGLVLLSSFAWFGLIAGGLTLIFSNKWTCSPALLFGVFAFIYVFMISPLITGIFLMAKKIVTHDEPSLLDLINGFKEFLASSWALGFAQLLMTLVIVVNAWYYLTRGSPAVKLVGIVFVYAFVLWVMSALYHYPILVEQRSGVLKILKRGVLLAMDNFAFTAGVLFVIILLACLCSVTVIGLALLYMGMASILQTRALRALFVKYELLPPEREPEKSATETA